MPLLIRILFLILIKILLISIPIILEINNVQVSLVPIPAYFNKIIVPIIIIHNTYYNYKSDIIYLFRIIFTFLNIESGVELLLLLL